MSRGTPFQMIKIKKIVKEELSRATKAAEAKILKRIKGKYTIKRHTVHG